MEVDDDLLTKETEQDKKEEVEMLEEFERRRKFKTVFESLEENDEMEMKQGGKSETSDQREDSQEKLEEVLKPDVENGETYDSKYVYNLKNYN
jgi:hypothetical protein